jgi:hypothetical protein
MEVVRHDVYRSRPQLDLFLLGHPIDDFRPDFRLERPLLIDLVGTDREEAH